MDTKIQVTIGAVLAALLGVGGTVLLSQQDFDEMAKEVDRVRAAQAKVAQEVGQYRETIPPELAKALSVSSLADKRMLSGDACKRLPGDRAACQMEGGNEIQFSAAASVKLLPEVEAIAAEWAAAVEAKAVEEAAKVAAEEEAKTADPEAVETP
jgi:outer membrane murein-binding lipoprotein Lpp